MNPPSVPLQESIASSQASGQDSRLSALRDGKRLCDDSVLLMLLAIALVTTVPWFFRDLPIRLGPITWSVFVFATVYLFATSLMEKIEGIRALRHALISVHALSVVFLAFVWHLAGNVQHPVFLLVFALPAGAAGWSLKSAQGIFIALLASICVAVVALANSPELQWHLVQLGVPEQLLAQGFLVASKHPYAGLELPVAYLSVMLVTFAVAIAAIALAAQSGANLIRRVDQSLAASRRALTEAHTLAIEIVRAAPHPTALIYVDTFFVAHASASFLHEMVLLPESLAEKNLFDLVAFSHPDMIKRLISGDGGDIAVAVYRIEQRIHLAKIHVRRIEHGGTGYACVSMHEIADAFFLRAALDAVRDVVLIIGADRKILAFNVPALMAFPGVTVGADASPLLREADTVEDWWDLGPRARRDRAVTLAGRVWQAAAVAARLPGEQDHLTIVALQMGSR